MNKVDVAIIGGGPAGLSAGLMLGRARKRTIVIDEGRPRNGVTREAHGFLTRDGISPSEFRRIAQEQLRVYPSVSQAEDTVVSISGEDGSFLLETATGMKIASKKLLFAAGMKDHKLEIPGLAEVYGKSAFVCPYCDGWELRDEPLVVISRGAALLHFAPLLSGWTKRFVVCTNGPDELSEAERDELRDHGIPLFDTPIRAILSSEGMVNHVVLEDGIEIPCTGIFFKSDLVPGTDLPQSLGCRTSDTGVIEVDKFGKSSVPGVYAAGDTSSLMHQSIAAAASGAAAGAAINGELNQEAWRKTQ
ncbi:NAD(P)/FAD-dependent oxidoreductase [Paenibacillus chitinolyticus]|uniref:NAD(P)/FAD-dependent oxidoreductase n=1 Tax=Paenibacillus chitinolyticus TaxID=79263 RepID=A0A410WYU4_9BACL|nr:NAD(P)/FAD-dependent oxidoreductase [Paenibacillus chitinolyticus]MCY9589999.1 NAD(P)/FAD-dependent oxidoreductase [Paenibacillus chitinolyticus]MCY9596337.1 NAD(P)/FAD-dependent oxidoreductase [Paenibacillus chitinolyticus]QAV19361.1 NAD(P)/FAD-dependent oxidoreductase [Paenibacillus chitinolyticus]